MFGFTTCLPEEVFTLEFGTQKKPPEFLAPSRCGVYGLFQIRVCGKIAYSFSQLGDSWQRLLSRRPTVQNINTRYFALYPAAKVAAAS